MVVSVSATGKEVLPKAVGNVLVFSPCSQSKCDHIDMPAGFEPKKPLDYLANPALAHKLVATRRQVLSDPQAQKGNRSALAFDLYVKATKSRAYKGIRESCYEDLRKRMLSTNDLQWFFLSGGFGVIHALEEATKYQATFDKGIAYQNDIPFTGKVWREAGLSRMCDAIVKHYAPSRVYVFGSKEYTAFIKLTDFWSERDDKGVKMFESTGRTGADWLSPRLQQLAEKVLIGSLDDFDYRYPERFYKQGECSD